MAISRLHLAAALLEYDNDSETTDPYQTKRSHRDSALFQPFQPRPLDHLIQSPSRTTSHAPQTRPQSVYTLQRSQNIPYTDQPVEDFSKWGIPHHLLSPDTDTRPPPLRIISMTTPQPEAMHQRAMSIHLDVLSGSISDSTHLEESQAQRPKSRGSLSGMLDDYGMEDALARAERMRRMAEGDYAGQGEEILNPIMVPLPTSPTSTHTTITPRPISSMSYNHPYPPNRPQSSTSHNRPISSRPVSSLSYSQPLSYETEEVMDESNPFALPAPPVEIGSRFDPKVLAAQRRDSFDGLSGERRRSVMLEYEGVHGEPGPSMDMSNYRRDSRNGATDRRISTLSTTMETTPNARLSTQSTVILPQSLTSPAKTYPTLPTPEEYGKPLLPNRYRPNPSFHKSHLRPRTLIMPSSLLNERPTPPIRTSMIPEGFVLGEKPMPAGSRSSILIGGGEGQGWKGLPLSSSQRTFRGGAEAGGRSREGWVGGPGQEGEGELGEFKTRGEGEYGDEEDRVEGYEGEMVESEGFIKGRKPGKLYGTSLLDQLEARKAALRGKQRVFTGDSRPSMMARPSLPNHTYQSQPNLQNPTTAIAPTNARAPLIQFDDNGNLDAIIADAVGNRDRISKSKSVFGVDQLWEKEMVKLRGIQERETWEREARELNEREEEERRVKKGKGKGKKDKGKGKAIDEEVSQHDQSILGQGQMEGIIQQDLDLDRRFGLSPIRPISDLPPTLRYSPEKGVPTTLPILTDNIPRQRANSSLGVDGWFGSSDEDDEEPGEKRRGTRDKGKAKQVVREDAESSDEEEIPLSRLAPMPRPETMISLEKREESSDEEDVPLSRFAVKSRLKPIMSSPSLANVAAGTDFGTGSLGLTVPVPVSEQFIPTEEDDDVPLGLRKSAQTRHSVNTNEVEDDLPLGYKHVAAATRQMATMSMYSPNPYAGTPWGMGGNPYNSPDPHMSMMGMGSPGMMMASPGMMMGSPYMVGGGMGMNGAWGSMPNMAAYAQGVGAVPSMGGMKTHMPVQVEAGRNIDSWRQGVGGDKPSSGSGGSGSRA